MDIRLSPGSRSVAAPAPRRGVASSGGGVLSMLAPPVLSTQLASSCFAILTAAGSVLVCPGYVKTSILFPRWPPLVNSSLISSNRIQATSGGIVYLCLGAMALESGGDPKGTGSLTRRYHGDEDETRDSTLYSRTVVHTGPSISRVGNKRKNCDPELIRWRFQENK